MGGKPKASTPADKRLAANKNKTPAAKTTAQPAFGSAAWRAKYGMGKKGK